MKEIKVNYPYEWEYKALDEVKRCFIAAWWKDHVKWTTLHEENKQAINLLRKDGVIQLRPFFIAANKEFDDFLCATFDAIRYDPYIEGIFFYVHSRPEDIQIRNKLLVDGLVMDHLSKAIEMKDISVDAELARSLWPNRKPVKAIPLSQFLIGQILTLLFDEYYHCREIDSVKMAGAEESVEKLRETRLYNNNEGTVYDYSPLFKKILKHDRELILEVFTEDEFNFQIKYISERLDEILCSYIQKQEPDPRPAIFFGRESSNCDLTIRYKTKEEKIPFRLLAKYKALIYSIARDFSLTTSNNPNRWKEEEIQEAMSALYQGAFTWDGKKGPVANWLSIKIKGHLKDVFKERSTAKMVNKGIETDELKHLRESLGFDKHKLLEEIEASGGYLDEPISDEGENAETYKDTLEHEGAFDHVTLEEYIDSSHSSSEVLKKLEKICEKNPKIRATVEKRFRDETLTPAERKRLERLKKDIFSLLPK